MNNETTPPPDDSALPDDITGSEVIPSMPETAETALSAADEAATGEIIAETDAQDDAIEAEELAADDELYDDDDGDYIDDESGDYEPLDDDEPVSSVDWAALAASGAASGVNDVPDLTRAGADAMDVDIDAALAAVDTLGDVVAAEQERKREEADRKEAHRRADEEYRKWAESYIFRRPGMIRVQGGRIVTILPAVALMAIGAVLTLATTSGQSMPLTTLMAVVSAGLSVSLLSYWLASGRWARGALFAALLVAIIGGWAFISALPTVTLSWTLPFAAAGAAFAITGLLGRPRSTAWILVGLGVVAGTLIMPLLSQTMLINIAPFVLAGAAVLTLLPAVFRVRRG